MVVGREAGRAWARQRGGALGVTEYWSLPGWTRLLQGGALVNNKSSSHTGLASKHLSENTKHYILALHVLLAL